MHNQLTHWDGRYVNGDTPWDSGQPSAELLRVIAEHAITPRAVLELGCGTGANAIELARRGFDVTGIDLSPTAVERARAAVQAANVTAHLEAADALAWRPAQPFPFVFDRGVYHVVRRIDVVGWLDLLRAAVAPGGLYLTLCGNAQDAAPAEKGPPRVAALDLIRELGLVFDLVQLREFYFEGAPINDMPGRHLAWSALWRRQD